jgi:hypothetical protein
MTDRETIARLRAALEEITETAPPLSVEAEEINRTHGRGEGAPAEFATGWRGVVRHLQAVARAALAEGEAPGDPRGRRR